MARSIIFQNLKVLLAKSGLRPSRLLAYINGVLEFGQWLRRHEVPVILDEKIALYSYLRENYLKDTSIDYLEFGVWQGATLKQWTALFPQQDSRFFGFDSFEGLPEEWDHLVTIHSKGTFDLGGVVPEMDDPRVTLIKGLFQDSLDPFLATFKAANPLVIHCDADLYSSTLYPLTRLNDVLIPGSLIIFDEFFTVGHECQALEDYVRSYRRKYRVLAASKRYAQLAIQITE